MRPPRPGRARPVLRPQRRGQRVNPRDAARRRQGWPPNHLLEQVLSACRETGMISAVDLGPEYHQATVVITPMAPATQPGGRGQGRANRSSRKPASGKATAIRGRKMACWGCGGKHRLRTCTVTTMHMKERIWPMLEKRDGIHLRAFSMPAETASAAQASSGELDSPGQMDAESKEEKRCPPMVF